MFKNIRKNIRRYLILMSIKLNKHGLNFHGVDMSDMDLTGVTFIRSNLSNVNFTNSILKDVVFSSVNLNGAIFNNTDITNVDLSESIISESIIDLKTIYSLVSSTSIPKIDNIFQKLYEVCSVKKQFNMCSWGGGCGTSKCIAGWTVFLGGDKGRRLQYRFGYDVAATIILRVNSNIPYDINFYDFDNEKMLGILKVLRDKEIGESDDYIKENN